MSCLSPSQSHRCPCSAHPVAGAWRSPRMPSHRSPSLGSDDRRPTWRKQVAHGRELRRPPGGPGLPPASHKAAGGPVGSALDGLTLRARAGQREVRSAGTGSSLPAGGRPGPNRATREPTTTPGCEVRMRGASLGLRGSVGQAETCSARRRFCLPWSQTLSERWQLTATSLRT